AELLGEGAEQRAAEIGVEIEPRAVHHHGLERSSLRCDDRIASRSSASAGAGRRPIPSQRRGGTAAEDSSYRFAKLGIGRRRAPPDPIATPRRNRGGRFIVRSQAVDADLAPDARLEALIDLLLTVGYI